MQDFDELEELYNDDEESEEYEEEYEERGVTDLQDDEEYEEKLYYENFPHLDSIYKEKAKEDYIPNNCTKEQENIYKKGIAQIKQINKKHSCNLSFNEIMNTLDHHYEEYRKQKNADLTNSITSRMWFHAYELSQKMEEKKSYSSFSTKEIANDLKNNFNKISKVVGLYVKLNPDKFPLHERERSRVFTSKGKLRSVFKQDMKIRGIKYEFDALEAASVLRKNAVDTGYQYFRKFSNPKKAQDFLVGKVKTILNGNGELVNSPADKVRKLAECVRLLRPLQAKRDHRSIWEFFTNHKVYVMERDTLQKCKDEIKSLGLSADEITKVLKGKAFNDVVFDDGKTVREAQEDIKASMSKDEVSNEAASKKPIVVNQVNEITKVLTQPIEENKKIIDMEKSF
jgi:hypothetical protein